jgi:hypothetical protein
MRTLIVLAVLVALGSLTGCATVAKTPGENQATYKRIADLDFRGVQDDWNMIWLADRPARLSKWHMR